MKTHRRQPYQESKTALLIFLFFLSFSLVRADPRVSYVKIVDTQSEVPGMIGRLQGFANPAVFGENIAFLSYELNFSRFSAYAVIDGTMYQVAASGMEVDGKFIQKGFSSVSQPLIDREGKVYWEVFLDGDHAVIQWEEGVLTVSFDQEGVSQLIGQPSTWPAYNEPRLTDDGRVVRMVTSSSPRGRWLVTNGPAGLKVANASTSLDPETIYTYRNYDVYREGFVAHKSQSTDLFGRIHMGSFESFETGFSALYAPEAFAIVESLFANGRWIVIQGRTPTQRGLFGWSGGAWFTIVREGDCAHDGTEITNFSDIDSSRHSQYENTLLFNGYTEVGRSIFVYRDGVAYRLISPGDSLDNEVVASLSINRGSLYGNRFVFHAIFHGGRAGVYLGDFTQIMPEPSAKRLDMEFNTMNDTGSISYTSEADSVYHLHSSGDLGSSVILESNSGNGSSADFSFDIGGGHSRRFYWIEKVRYASRQ